MSDGQKKGDIGISLVVGFSIATAMYVYVWLSGVFGDEGVWIGPFGTLLFGGFAVMCWIEYIRHLSPTWRERIRRIIEPAVYLFGFAWLLAFVMMVGLPLVQQVMYWLRYGELVDRDLYWLIAEASCAQTNWQAMGWEGKELCRNEALYQTGWIGADRIIGFVLDLHLSLIFIAASAIVLFIGAKLIAALDGPADADW